MADSVHPQLFRDVVALERQYGREALAQAVLERLWVDWDERTMDPAVAVRHLLLLNEQVSSHLHDLGHVADDLRRLVLSTSDDDRSGETMAARVRRLGQILDALRAVYRQPRSRPG